VIGKGRHSHLLVGHYENELNDLSFHNLSVQHATELELDSPLCRLLAACGAMHKTGAMMMMMTEWETTYLSLKCFQLCHAVQMVWKAEVHLQLQNVPHHDCVQPVTETKHTHKHLQPL